MNWFNKSISEVEQVLKTNINSGLTTSEVKTRLEKFGLNQLPSKKPTPWVIIFLKNLFEPLSIVLMIVALLILMIPLVFIKKVEYIEPLVIFTIVFINSTINTIQAIKVRKSLQALKKLTIPKISVLRNNVTVEIDVQNLVIGDIVILEAGKYIPADLRLFDTQNLMINESTLTGESILINKTEQQLQLENPILAEQINIGFMSTLVAGGRAKGIVINTAADSTIGKIAQSIINTKPEKSPLQLKLQQLSRWISFIAVILAILIFTILFLKNNTTWNSHLIVAVTLAVAVIPESLTIIISIILSISVRKMVKKNVIVKKLVAVETLGAVNIICSDKTGTLTQNIMKIRKYWFNNETSNENVKNNLNDKYFSYLLYGLILCNDATINNKQKIGDPTEVALIDWVQQIGININNIRHQYPRINEIPFDSDRKLMSTVNLINDEKIIFTKGALDQLLDKTTAIYLDHKIINITSNIKNDLLDINNIFSQQGLRVIAFAYRKFTETELEAKLIFLGMVAMEDPIREEAKEAVLIAKKSGIRTIMITGDYKLTALAIAKQLLIAEDQQQVLEGKQLQIMTNEELLKKVDEINVYARVNPEDKVRIVNALQKRANIVAMTGDGVNDASSLNKADIGVAMGITGTDVAKEAADIIITDDNFKTIVTGVDEGRNIYQKILRSITFIFSANLAQVLVIFIIALIFNISPLNASNILWFNLIVETILAIPIALDRNDQTLLFNQPRSKKENIFKKIIIPIVSISLILTLTVILGFIINYHLFDDKVAKTAVFMILINSPIFYVALIKLSNYRYKKLTQIYINWTLIIAMLIALFLNIFIIFTPNINTLIFKLNVIPVKAIMINMGLIFLPALLILIYKNIIYFSYKLFLNKSK